MSFWPRPEEVNAWLAAQEAGVPNLRPGAEKRVIWAGTMGQVADLSVVFVHWFSAAAEEIRPVPDLLAAALGANLHFARLARLGRDGAAMGEVDFLDWMDSTTQIAWLIIEPTTKAANIRLKMPKAPAAPDRAVFPPSIIRHTAAKGIPAVINAMASVMMP